MKKALLLFLFVFAVQTKAQTPSAIVCQTALGTYTAGSHTVALTATNVDAESGQSTPVTFTMPGPTQIIWVMNAPDVNTAQSYLYKHYDDAAVGGPIGSSGIQYTTVICASVTIANVPQALRVK